MRKLIPILFLFIISCSPVDSGLQAELDSLKAKLVGAEKALLEKPKDETAFIHTVFFWMKDEVTAEQNTTFAKKGLVELSKVSSIYKSYIGPPAGTPERGVVDNTYSHALIVHFKSAADQDKYQVDPIHLKFIEDCYQEWKQTS